MKPKANGCSGETLAASNDEDISLYKAYETIGLLITESRIPDRSAKGRREGVHIPQNFSTHRQCQDDKEECIKIRRYKEAIANLCYNGIPLCAEVLLCPHCEIGAAESCTGQSLANLDQTHEVGSAHSDSYVLLEQWTIQQVHSRADSSIQSLQNLCNAVRSQLCFSQLSAWLQLSEGATPKHIFYRLTAPGEWFVHKFVMSPQSHKFLDASLGRSRHSLRVTLSSLPRTSLTPFEISIASRDKLFAVKDASPLLRKSRSSFNNLGSTEAGAEVCLVGKTSSANERTHSRSRSVRGMQDLSGRKMSALTTGTQRSNEYSDDANISGLSAAEKLASFSTVPTNSINNLELISCTTGTPTAKASAPERLSITCGRGASLKSPKVLFTRTAVRDNFFAVPSFNCSSDLTSQLNSVHIDSGDETNDDSTLTRHKPHFDIGEETKSTPHTQYPKYARRKLEPSFKSELVSKDHSTDNISLVDSSCSAAEHHGKSQNADMEQVQSSVKVSKLLDNRQYITNGRSHRTGICTNNEGTKNGFTSEHSDNNVKHYQEVNSSAFREGTENGTPQTECSDTKAVCRKSRKHQSQDNYKNSLYKGCNQIRDTPINKKLQSIKTPQGSRSRLFKQRPLQSSPAPLKRIGRNNFGYDKSINNVEAIKNALSCTSLSDHAAGEEEGGDRYRLVLSSSAPAFSTAFLQSHNSLLGNFEESMLNGRIDPAGVVNGFTVVIGASGSFCPKHVSLPVEAYFFNSLSDNDASSPYLGYVDLSEVSRRGYQIPRKGTLQITLFYPNHKVNKMFVVTYDLTDMPPKSQTFIRQKTIYAPCEQQRGGEQGSHGEHSNGRKLPTYLRYLIHLRLLSTKTNKIFLHTDIRLIYARDKFEFDSRVASYELRSFIESPSDPRYSPIK